jgi:putative aminopeptidase FrvX
MDNRQLRLLETLLSTPGPSGEERAVARIWREEAEDFADEVHVDVCGNSIAVLQGDAPRLLLAAHIDEIGLMLTHIDEDGTLYFGEIGDTEAPILVGQRVRLLGRNGDVLGVVVKKFRYSEEGQESKDEIKIQDLWIDIGVRDRAEALEIVQVGTVGVIDAPVKHFPNQRLVARGIDNRVGAFTILESLRRLAGARPRATVIAAATVQEEISHAGAQTITYDLKPDMALVVDMTYATDHPEADRKQYGDIRLGGGPVFSPGSANNPKVYGLLVETAEREEIAYSLQATPASTDTDADVVFMSRAGIATGLISIPCRYMHTPNEMVELGDVEATINLICAFVRALSVDINFLPE